MASPFSRWRLLDELLCAVVALVATLESSEPVSLGRKPSKLARSKVSLGALRKLKVFMNT